MRVGEPAPENGEEGEVGKGEARGTKIVPDGWADAANVGHRRL